jgi:iron uptake system component EfeO
MSEDCKFHSVCLVGMAVVAACLNSVLGTAGSAAPLDDAVERYRAFLIEDVEMTLEGARRLQGQVAAGDLDGAKQSWIDARAGWERSETFTGEFVPQLDREIDAWPDAQSGFHAIEAKLFGANRTDVQTETQALVRSLAQLNDVVRAIPMPLQKVFNGVTQLAYELGESKVDGGESRVSGTSLADMRNNIIGIARTYQLVVAPMVAPEIAAAAERDIDSLKTMLTSGDLKRVDADELRALSEQLVLTLQKAAPALGLKTPVLESGAQ